jgi:hypothetical protein
MKDGMVGRKFGKLTVIGFVQQRYGRTTMWRCACECGERRVVARAALTTGKTVSCGCHRKKAGINFTLVDQGGTETPQRRVPSTSRPEYKNWLSMRQRCKTHLNYLNVKVCDRWSSSFDNFLSDMGPKPTPDHTIDRIDPSGHYEPSNCRWATMAEQAANKRNTTWVYVQDKRTTLAAFARLCGISHQTVSDRLGAGWTASEILASCGVKMDTAYTSFRFQTLQRPTVKSGH